MRIVNLSPIVLRRLTPSYLELRKKKGAPERVRLVRPLIYFDTLTLDIDHEAATYAIYIEFWAFVTRLSIAKPIESPFHSHPQL